MPLLRYSGQTRRIHEPLAASLPAVPTAEVLRLQSMGGPEMNDPCDRDAGLWDASSLLPVGVNVAHMYANKIFDQAAGQGLVQRKLDRVFGGLVVLELVLQLLDRP